MRMRTCVNSLPVVRNLVCGEELGNCIVGELLCADSLVGDVNVHALCLCLLEDCECIRHKFVLVQGKTDLSALGLDECVTHSTADDKVVNLSEEVLENCELGRNLCSADDCGKRLLCVVSPSIR